MTRNAPSPEGEALGRELARMNAASAEKARAFLPEIPDPCGTCAFRLGTVPNRCLTTVMDAIKCVMEKDSFMCHEGDYNADGKPETPCAGWAVGMMATRDSVTEMPYDYSGAEADGP